MSEETCLHLDKACKSWRECAERTAKHSAARVTDAIDQFAAASTLGAELAKARGELAIAVRELGFGDDIDAWRKHMGIAPCSDTPKASHE